MLEHIPFGWNQPNDGPFRSWEFFRTMKSHAAVLTGSMVGCILRGSDVRLRISH